jgi:hypothetical protein
MVDDDARPCIGFWTELTVICATLLLSAGLGICLAHLARAM